MIVSNLSVPLLGLVDAAILGHLPDPRYLGAVAVATSLFGFLYWGFGFLRMGTTGLVAQRSGTAAPSAAERLGRDGALRLLAAQSVLLALAIAALVVVAAPWLFPLGLSLMGAPPEIATEAERYFVIRLGSAPAVLVTYALTGLLVGLQDTRAVLVVMVATNVVNIVLDVLFVPVLGLRTEGVATATLIAEWLGCGVALLAARRRLATHPAPLDLRALGRLERYRELLAVNGHLFVRTLALLAALAFFTAQGARQGAAVLAANALLVNLLMTTSYGLDGFAHAAEALTGRHYGARDGAAFARTLRSALLFCVLTACGFTMLFAFAGDVLLGLLTDLAEVRALAGAYLPWLALLPLIAVWCFLFDGVAIGLTATREMRDSMLISALLVYLPLWWLTRPLGNTGLWLALVAFFAARGLTLGLWLAAGQRRGRFFPTDQSPLFFGRG
jgi:MATE family multidrug resistance protein